MGVRADRTRRPPRRRLASTRRVARSHGVDQGSTTMWTASSSADRSPASRSASSPVSPPDSRTSPPISRPVRSAASATTTSRTSRASPVSRAIGWPWPASVRAGSVLAPGPTRGGAIPLADRPSLPCRARCPRGPGVGERPVCGVGRPRVQGAIIDAGETAVRETLGWLEREAVHVRRGTGNEAFFNDLGRPRTGRRGGIPDPDPARPGGDGGHVPASHQPGR
jgi:hypothetical protein